MTIARRFSLHSTWQHALRAESKYSPTQTSTRSKLQATLTILEEMFMKRRVLRQHMNDKQGNVGNGNAFTSFQTTPQLQQNPINQEAEPQIWHKAFEPYATGEGLINTRAYCVLS
jgi:hypothetical protein